MATARTTDHGPRTTDHFLRHFPTRPVGFLDERVRLRGVGGLRAASHHSFFPVRRATLPSRMISVRRALYSKFPLAGAPPLQASIQSR